MNLKNKNIDWLKKEKVSGETNPSFIYNRNSPSIKPEGNLNRPLLQLLENDVDLDNKINLIKNTLNQYNHDHNNRYYNKTVLGSDSEEPLIHINNIFNNEDSIYYKHKKIYIFERPILSSFSESKNVTLNYNNSDDSIPTSLPIDFSRINTDALLLCTFYLNPRSLEGFLKLNNKAIGAAGGFAHDCFGKYSWINHRDYYVTTNGYASAIVKHNDNLTPDVGVKMTIHGYLE